MGEKPCNGRLQEEEEEEEKKKRKANDVLLDVHTYLSCALHMVDRR